MFKNRIVRIQKQVLAGILCLVLAGSPVFLLYSNGAEIVGDLYSTGAVLMDGDSGRVLFSKNGKETYAMASTTKIMTCILALELGKPDQIVTFSDYAASMPDVQMNAKSGEQYYLKDLLYSTMLESHNDSAVAVAEAIGGDVDRFCRLMDKKAEAVGCMKTNFVTPNGLDGEDEEGEHCTTPEELAMILRYCTTISSKAKEFIEITGTKCYSFQEINGKRYVNCNNHNTFLSSYEGAFTGKTGFTGKAGYCYTGAAKKEEKTMIIALLGAGWYPNRSLKWKDAKKLLDYGFENYDYQFVGKDEWSFSEIPVIDGMEESVKIATDAKKFLYLLKKDEVVQCKIEHAKQLQAPIEENTVVGTITYELNGTMIEQFKIYTVKNVEKSTFWNIVKKWLKILQDFVGNLTNK
jgi:D-alanyl-D-alanine carboxypeptidase (penicillin-binding protein 5/6)